jgi:DNA-binding response OmpR family regulator
MSGEALCTMLRKSGPSPSILVLTAQSRVASRVRCLDAGADDYLTKPFAVAELRARVRALARRAPSRPAAVILGRVRIDFAARRAFVDGVEAPITAREWAMLQLMASRGQQIVRREELLEALWNRTNAGASASLEVLIGRIRRKLGPDVVRTIRGEGYALGGE